MQNLRANAPVILVVAVILGVFALIMGLASGFHAAALVFFLVSFSSYLIFSSISGHFGDNAVNWIGVSFLIVILLPVFIKARENRQRQILRAAQKQNSIPKTSNFSIP